MPSTLGAIFQSSMDKAERRGLGAHYTSEANILALLGPAMLEPLRAELEAVKGSSEGLERFLAKLAAIRVLDPACGCGDFLLVALRELRRLELDAVKAARIDPRRVRVGLDQMFGIEIDEAAAAIARAALVHAGAALGVDGAPNILDANALAVDWGSFVAPEGLTFVVGNPPFVGKKEQSDSQKQDMKRVFPGLKGVGKLDYVACWFMKAARFAAEHPAAEHPGVSVAFVSTNSVTQGEQVGILWGALFELGMKIHFAHRSFPWTSEAKGKAAVHCVIIGFGVRDVTPKRLYEYEAPEAEPRVREVGCINAYLVEGPDVLLRDRATPLGAGPKVTYGSFALDEGRYTLKPSERDDLLAACPDAAKFIKPFVGGEELIHAKARFCLWLADATSTELDAMPEVAARVEHVKRWRAASPRPETRALAATPTRFAEIRQPTARYLAFPTLSSEHRAYIPIDFLEPDVIASNQIYVFSGATLYHFGILGSDAHMTWVRAVCGRLESRYRYSAGIVYNNFPWPEPDPNQREAIETRARAVLTARATHRETPLAKLYDPRTMPANLLEAHRELDEAVYAAYGTPLETTESQRAAILFELHQRLTMNL